MGDVSNTVFIYSLYPEENCTLGTQTFSSRPLSISLLRHVQLEDDVAFHPDDIHTTCSERISLYIGFEDGSLFRAFVDPNNGEFRETRTRSVGTKPVQLFKLTVGTTECVLVRGVKCWLYYTHLKKDMMTPLSYFFLDCATSFTSSRYPNGVIGCVNQSLRVFTIDRLGDCFSQVFVTIFGIFFLFRIVDFFFV